MGKSQPLYDDDDTDDENQVSTPRQPVTRTGVRKRLSEVHFADDATDRPPLRSVINDDAAEKRRRRKSTKLAVNNDAGNLSVDASTSGDATAADTSRTIRQKQLLNAVAATAKPIDFGSKADMNANYEEWMKMATDGKINQNNSWNFALIDYFHDLRLLRNDDDDSINFQRASCTLDGCVKIWTSRVDSVGTETAKLANNLASGGGHGSEEEDAGHDSDNPDDENTQGKKKKSHRSGVTLAKDAAQLQNKKPDLEFSVDPLFKKTCADFDEGGAHGLLMNHLSLGVGSEGALTVVFDAGESQAKGDEDDEQEAPEDVDLSYLRSQFFLDLGVLESKAITNALDDFSFAQGPSPSKAPLFDHTQRDDDDDDEEDDFGPPPDMDFGGDDGPQDFFAGDDAIPDDFGGGLPMGGDDDDQSHEGSTEPSGSSGAGYASFDPRNLPKERELIMAMTEEDNNMDYFDQSLMRNWAGPEHWKMRKIIRRADAATGAKATKTRREKKEASRIDFNSIAEKDLADVKKDLFAAPARGGINLPKPKKGEEESDHTLPDDMHFSSRQLTTLFLKPKFTIKIRGKRQRLNDGAEGEPGPDFWAQPGGEVDDDDRNDTGIPFNTQFFHDDDDDDAPGFDDGYDGEVTSAAGGLGGDDAGEQDLLAATQGQSRRVKPEFVNYARRAKRVDVRKLKENIWKGLDIVIKPKNEEEEDGMDVDPEEPLEPTDPSEGREFKSVISNLQDSYPQEKMQDISTSFMFICLLHLANEQGLKIASTTPGLVVEDDDDGSGPPDVQQEQVGNIWDLQVYRDPNASQAC